MAYEQVKLLQPLCHFFALVKGGIIAATTLGGTTLGSVTGAGSPEALMAMPDFYWAQNFKKNTERTLRP